jgi:hypothetical protein
MAGPNVSTIKRLFAVSGNQCAFPNCPQVLYDNGAFVAEICHIKGDKQKAPRYGPQQTDDDRHSFENLFLLCSTHHTVIDQDVKTYTVEHLEDMKRLHEGNKQSKFAISDSEANRLALFAGGMTIGAMLGILAKTFGDLVSAGAPQPTKKREPPAFDMKGHRQLVEAERRTIQALGSGNIAVAAKDKQWLQFANSLSLFLLTTGWRGVDANIYLPVEGMPDRLIVIIIEHHSPKAIEVITTALEPILARFGFRRMNPNDLTRPTWNSPEMPLRIALLQVMPGQRATI